MYDTDIDNYNEHELIQLLKISTPIESITRIQISEHLDRIISKLSVSSHGVIIDLFKKASAKLQKMIQVKQSPFLTADPPLTTTALTSNSILNTSLMSDSGSYHSVMRPHHPAAINTSETPYSQGIINPIQKKIITKVINIDSVFRSNYNATTGSNFMWKFLQPETNVVSMRVSSVDIPIMWFAITDTNNRNQFYIKLFNLKDKFFSGELITIPPGNYMTDTFTNTLNLIFKKQGNGLEYLISDIDEVTTKTVIRVMDKDDIKADPTGLRTHAAYDEENEFYAPKLYFTLNFFPEKDKYSSNVVEREFRRTIGWYLGFRKYKYQVRKEDTITQVVFDPFHKGLSYMGAIESESSYSSTRDNYIFLAIDDYNRNCVCQPIVSSIGDSDIGNNILARITVDTIHNSILYDNNSDKIFKERIYMGPITVEKLKITVLNRYGEIIDLNANDFSFTLEFTKLY